MLDMLHYHGFRTFDYHIVYFIIGKQKQMNPLTDTVTLNLWWCGYSQATNDDFDWTKGAGSTPSSGTGPRTDHTRGTCKYIQESRKR